MKCPKSDCNKYYKTLNTFTEHNYHSNRIYCDFSGCGKSFNRKAKRDNHSLIHKNLKPFACDWKGCDYRCRIKWELIKHKLVHKTDRLYKCPFDGCDKRFKSIQVI